MNKFTVYQLDVSREVYDTVNRVGHTEAFKLFPVWKLRMDLQLQFDNKTELTDEEIGYFKPVCIIHCRTVDEVFHIGNMGPENQIDRLAQMHSVSVGDVIVNNENNQAYLVQPVGLTKIKFK